MVGAYVGRDEVGDEVEAEAPPNGTENVARDLLHSSHEANAVVHFWKELEEEDD